MYMGNFWTSHPDDITLHRINKFNKTEKINFKAWYNIGIQVNNGN